MNPKPPLDEYIFEENVSGSYICRRIDKSLQIANYFQTYFDTLSNSFQPHLLFTVKRITF